MALVVQRVFRSQTMAGSFTMNLAGRGSGRSDNRACPTFSVFSPESVAWPRADHRGWANGGTRGRDRDNSGTGRSRDVKETQSRSSSLRHPDDGDRSDVWWCFIYVYDESAYQLKTWELEQRMIPRINWKSRDDLLDSESTCSFEWPILPSRTRSFSTLVICLMPLLLSLWLRVYHDRTLPGSIVVVMAMMTVMVTGRMVVM